MDFTTKDGTIKTLPNEVVWELSRVLKEHDNPPPDSQWRYTLELPSFLAVWDVFAAWERERFLDMEKHLKQGDILFDIGTEAGWCNIIYAKFCGAENVVLIEPTDDFWPNIKALWERNYPGVPPLANYMGLFSDKTTSKKVLPKHEWPKAVNKDGGALMHSRSYVYIHDNFNHVPEIKLDDYVKLTGIVPNALTMDVEGAELLILKGAEKTLKENNLKVWVSIHNELGLRDYNQQPDDVYEFMRKCGYQSEFLATDHEDHVRFFK